MLTGLALPTLGVLAMATPAAPTAADCTVIPGGGAAGGPALHLPNGDLLNVRNIQSGTWTGNPADLNLDIGAGSTEHPGDIALNWDVGRRTLIYDGRKRLLASFGPRGIRFYVRPRVAPR